jgi:polysaccharide biosynthesis transport protein
MLQNRFQALPDDKARAISDDIQPAIAGAGGIAELLDWVLGLFRRQYLVISFIAALGVAAGIIYLGVATPIYTAQTTVYIDLHSNPINQQPGIFGNDPIQIESQIQIITSKTIALSVIKKLHLMDDLDSGADKKSAFDFFRPLFGKSARSPNDLSNDSETMERIIAAFLDNLNVEVAAGRVVLIKYSSPSPDQAAQIANAVANAYITDQLEAKYQANRIATNWLQERQQQLLEQAEGAQRAAESFKQQSGIVMTDGKPLDNAQVAELNSRLVAARTMATDISARLNRLEAIVRLGPSDPHIGAISEINSPIATALRQQYLELARRESEWSARFGKDHLAVVNLRNRMQEIRSSLFDELRQAVETAKNDYAIAKQRQEEIEKQLAETVAQSRSTSPAQVTLQGLEGTAASYRKLYDGFLQQYMGPAQQATLPITEARVISVASPPLQKSKPKSTLVLAISLFGGLGLGLALGVLRDTLDRVFRTGKQLETHLQVPCVALVPLVKDEKSKQIWHRSLLDLRPQNSKISSDNPKIYQTVIDAPLSSFAEAIRSIKLTIDLYMEGRPCKVIGFTSTLPNEGKSTIAAALAHLIAQVGGRALLVDCDLRNPTLTRMFSRTTAPGIFDVVAKKTPLADAIFRDPSSNVSLLPAGKRIPLFLTSETLGGESIMKLFENLRQNYNYILVDLPPLSPIVDVRASTHFVDAYLLTVEWGRTTIDTVEQSLAGVPKIYDSLLGTILNKTDMNAIRRYDSSGRYGHNDHYARYGYSE